MNLPGAGDEYGPDWHWPRIGGAVALAVVAGFLVWLLVIRDDDQGPAEARVVATEVQSFGPALAGSAELRDAASQVGHPVYWAGTGEEGTVELTLSADGRAFVRYLTGDASPGAESADFLTVSTYEIENAEAALEEVSGNEGGETFELPGGGIAVANSTDPQRVYFTPAGSDLQVEVFDPEPGRARQLVEANEIEPIG